MKTKHRISLPHPPRTATIIREDAVGKYVQDEFGKITCLINGSMNATPYLVGTKGTLQYVPSGPWALDFFSSLDKSDRNRTGRIIMAFHYSKDIHDGNGNRIGSIREIDDYGYDVWDGGGNRQGSTNLGGTFDKNGSRISSEQVPGMLIPRKPKK